MLSNKKVSAIILAGFMSLSAESALAASEDECAIWLCLPAGFPSGCGGALSAFKKRIRNLQPPLVSIASCGGDGADYRTGSARFIPANTICGEWNERNACVRYINPTDEYVHNSSCEKDADFMTCQDKKFVEIIVDGKVTGNPFYY